MLVGQTTASEFGGINCTYTRLHGATSNPYDLERTPGGSSGGSAASVSGGLFPICTGGDGGGSIRIPAGFTGLFGLKATFGRIPKGPHTEIEPLTAVIGCLSRSVRDTARWYDVCNGYDEYDPYSLPRGRAVGRPASGHQDVRGMRVAVCADLGAAVIASAVREKVEEAADLLIKDAELDRIDVPIDCPGAVWSGPWPARPACWSVSATSTPPARPSSPRRSCWPPTSPPTTSPSTRPRASRSSAAPTIVQVAQIFDQVDFIICATNPDVAFGAQGPMPTTVDGVDLICRARVRGGAGQ